MSELAERAERELSELVARYGAAEAEVVRVYFSQPHTDDEYLDLVLRQAGREIHTAYQMTRALRMLDELESGADRHALYDLMDQMADEVKHYGILADLAERYTGRKLGRDLLKYWVFAVYDPMVPRERLYNDLLPEANAQLDLGRQLMEHFGFERGRALTRLSEGGGGGAFIEATRHHADEFQKLFAEAMGRIYLDEVDHGPNRVHDYAYTRIRSAEQLDEERGWLQRFLSGHLRVRNEIYGHSLSPERLSAIDAGEALEPMGTMEPSIASH